ncbi:hypothetical protein H0H81_007110 [Sphagnurus paluster]|uniref:Uncharacterized protein n=1 Tax=Sphagnurus paluster TaxID=117069 RepID=A0A9P7FQZ1_9AGAR|nr:hypothetical protein H0H81_007110 [Sphagnurus paluster]
MLLYHGTRLSEVPAVPEWLATDPEHSYLFTMSGPGKGSRQFTFVTTRPLKVLYFDGSSAAKMKGGPLDSQDILWSGDPFTQWDERSRINGLCDWGKQFGLDGFVRMEMDFEVMLCDFSDGLEIVSQLDLVSSRKPHRSSSDNTTKADEISQLVTTVIETGSWHNHYPGDPRIELDFSRLVSFYDTSLAPSLVPSRRQQKRYEHRPGGVSAIDVQAVRQRLADALTTTGNGSGIQWKSLFRIITLRYADRLEMIRYLLNTTEAETSRSPVETAKLVQQQLRISLTPYIIMGAVPVDEDAGPRNHSWTASIFKDCAVTHTDFISSSPSIASSLTPSEQLILRAIRDTNKEICRVTVKMWAEGVFKGLDPVLKDSSSSAPDADGLGSLMDKWKSEIDRLFEWLDWSVWVKCRPACGFEEMCYLPTWPFLVQPGAPASGPKPEGPSPPAAEHSDEQNDWLIPEPKCLRRLPPFNPTPRHPY